MVHTINVFKTTNSIKKNFKICFNTQSEIIHSYLLF